MTLIPAATYSRKRQAYRYEDPGVELTIAPTQTGDLPYLGHFKGILPGTAPLALPKAINLRKFEIICRSVFSDCIRASRAGVLTHQHLANLKQVVSAIVHWKMASQGGRAKRNVTNVLALWNDGTPADLLRAYEERNLSMFRIAGIRIPTASAFMRFLFPESFGIMDSRVVNLTQAEKITTLSVRQDGYISDTSGNVRKF